MNGFRSMGCAVVCSLPTVPDDVRALFRSRDSRFSRFQASSELNRVNAVPLGVALLSEEFASMLSLSLDAARATDGLVTPCVGDAVIAAGYDRDFGDLPADGVAVEPARVPDVRALSLRGRILLRSEPVTVDLNGVVKGRTVDDAAALVRDGWIAAGGDVATNVPVSVGLPAGGRVTLVRGGLATSSVAKRRWRRGGETQNHLVDPGTGASTRSLWRDVSVSAPSCLAADVAAKAALLLGETGPEWLDERGLPGRFVAHDGSVVCNDAWLGAVTGALAA